MSKQYTRSEPSEEQQQTRERIIAAASKVLAAKGYDATTLREISREAQAAPGLVDYYFGGKDQLLVEALQAAGQRFHQRMEHLAQQMSTNWSLDALLTQLYERVDLEPEVYRLRYELFALGLHNPVIEPKVRERLAQRRDEIGSIIARALENRERTESVKRFSLIQRCWRLSCSLFLMGWRCKRSWTPPSIWKQRITCLCRRCTVCSKRRDGAFLTREAQVVVDPRGSDVLGTGQESASPPEWL